MKHKKFNVFPNHGDEDGRNGWTVCYGEVDDVDHIIIGAEDTKRGAQEMAKRLNGIIKIDAADKQEVKEEFHEATKNLVELDPSGESLSATRVYESLEWFRDKCLGKI